MMGGEVFRGTEGDDAEDSYDGEECHPEELGVAFSKGVLGGGAWGVGGVGLLGG